MPGYGVILEKKKNQETFILVSVDPDAAKLSMDQELKGRWQALLPSWPGAEAFCPGSLSASQHTRAQTLKSAGSARKHWESLGYICIPTDHFLPSTQEPALTLFQSAHRMSRSGPSDAIAQACTPILHHSQLCDLGPLALTCEGSLPLSIKQFLALASH